MEYDVTINRDKYIGGSDISILMGLSKFKTRYQLLLEKAGISKDAFGGNVYTEYGNVMESKIRAYINETYKVEYLVDQLIKDDMRANFDGLTDNSVLEIKTTSQIYDYAHEYKHYLVQLLFYMNLSKRNHGILAVYERPEGFNEEFEKDRLQVFEINIGDYDWLLDEIEVEVDNFRADLARIKENPLLSEEDFQPNELVTLSRQVLSFERRLAEYKTLEQEYKDMKQKLFDAMAKHDIKSWQTIGGVRITRVDRTEATAKIVKELNVDLLKVEQPEIYENYLEEKIKKTSGRSGYVKITQGKK